MGLATLPLPLMLGLPLLAVGSCPFAGSGGRLPSGHPAVGFDRQRRFAEALMGVDFDAVRVDIRRTLTDSKDFWPADFGNYGPLFVRLAWHCSGSYRLSDGRGGCDGGRIRFDPERSWEDNTNLDKALKLLAPIKAKHGTGLSWGDLIILAGNTAISSMGGPVLGFCAGRMDDDDGSESLPLGPSAEQQQVFPCDTQGACKPPLGSTTVGLIYVNPEGPLGMPDPITSAAEIREVFGRMGMNDSETVALIGGGHAFGKAHGSCPAGAGPSPRENPADPWPGRCGRGRGPDAFTSGFELQWTPTPTAWSNAFFKQLAGHNWTMHQGPAGKSQWHAENASASMAKVGMLTSDVALMHDPRGDYQHLVAKFADDLGALNHAFSHAWYKLTTRDMGPATRCFGTDVPPAQPFQHPLPSPPAQLANFGDVRNDILDLIVGKSLPDVVQADVFGGEPYYGAFFVRLAWHCMNTFRASDWRGGCNGARIRHVPELEREANNGLSLALRLLEPIKDRHGDGLSWADLIVFAGTVALVEAGGRPMRFCGGRTDAADGSGSEGVEPRHPNGSSPDDVAQLKDFVRLFGLTMREFTVLLGGGHNMGKMHPERSGFFGPWTSNPRRLTNEFFRVLLREDWETIETRKGQRQFKAKGKHFFMLPVDMNFRTDPELLTIAEDYAADEELFLDDFAAAWTRMMNADRFNGPTGSVCSETEDFLVGDVVPAPPTSRAAGRWGVVLAALVAIMLAQ